jgi:hypothetical protein
MELDVEKEHEEEVGKDTQNVAMDEDVDGETTETFNQGDTVLVRSGAGKSLWKATVIENAHHRSTGAIVGYRLHYKGWGTQYDEWVMPNRVLAPDQKNLQLKSDLQEACYANPKWVAKLVPGDDDRNSLQKTVMIASNHVFDPKRARGAIPQIDMSVALHINDPNSSDEKMLAKLRSALLTIESALPFGSVNTSAKGSWNPLAAAQWRKSVERATGPVGLMGAVILLENALDVDWLRSQAARLISSLPTHSKALKEVTYSSVATRVYMLDRSLKYGAVAGTDGKPKKSKSSFGAGAPKGNIYSMM